jgi:hypothetical protein
MIEKHVPRKDLCKKLYDLGVRMEAVFVWAKHKGEHKPRIEPRMRIHNMEFEEIEYTYPAPLASEILERLPAGYVIGKTNKWYMEKGYKAYYCCHVEELLLDDPRELYGDCAADAANLRLIYLIEQGIIKVEDINGRMG